MNRLINNSISFILVLKEYLGIICDHYPSELIGLIIANYYKLQNIHLHCYTNNLSKTVNYLIMNGSTYVLKEGSKPFWYILPEKIKKIRSTTKYTLLLTESQNVFFTDNVKYPIGYGIGNATKIREKKWRNYGDISVPNIVDINIYPNNTFVLVESDQMKHHIYQPHGNKGNFTEPKAKKTASGVGHMVRLDQDNNIFSGGFNNYGQLGIGHNFPEVQTVQINLKNIKQICCGNEHSMALTNEGEVYVWGRNNMCQLGLENCGYQNSPQKLDLPCITNIKCGFEHSMALTSKGEVYVWGKEMETKNYNELNGRWSTTISLIKTPQKINLDKVIKISAGGHGSMMMTASLDIYSWGINDSKQNDLKKISLDI
jgi:alpha-tubulin suppressor-like RCC1 family protein